MFVGSDVHKKYTEVAIVDEDGVVEKQERMARAMAASFEVLIPKKPFPDA